MTDLRAYTMYTSCEPCFMCSGAMVWVKLGRLVYGASNTELEGILGNEGCNCSQMVFEHSFWQPQVTAGVLREECLAVLKAYFGTHSKGCEAGRRQGSRVAAMKNGDDLRRLRFVLR